MRISYKLKYAILLASSVFLFTGCGSKQLTMTFPVTGYSECTIIQYDGYTVMIDAGDSHSTEEILKSLNTLNITKLDALILTSYSTEHIGGASEILKAFATDRIIGCMQSRSSSAYNQLLNTAEQQNIEIEIPADGDLLEFGKLKFTIDTPDQDSYDSDRVDNMSSIVSMSYRKTNYLFTSDIHAERATEFVENHRGTNTEFDIITLPDHGQDSDTAVNIFEHYSNIGTTGIVSSSLSNPEDTAILDELPTTGIFLSREGVINVTSNGRNVTVTQD